MVRTRSRPYSLCHPPHTKAHIKGFGSSYLHVYACWLLYFTLVLASLILGFTMLDAFRRLDLVWLHLTPIRPCSDVNIWKASPDAALLHAYPSALRDAMLTMPIYATHWLSMHLYTLAHMSMHKSFLLVCRPCFNTIKLWTFDPNLHLSLMDATFCLLSWLFVLFACLLVSLLAMSITLFCFMLFHMLFASFLSIACLLVSCLCLCMYTHGARMHRVRAHSPRHKQKGRGCKHVSMSQTTMLSRFRGLASLIWLCTFLNPLPPSFLS